MVCPNCGAPLNNFDAFCPACGKYALPLQNPAPEAPQEKASEEKSSEDPPKAPTAASKAPKTDRTPQKVPKRLYPPEDANMEKKQKREKRPAGRNLVILTIVMAVLAAAALGVAVYISANTASLRVQARKAQTEKNAAEASAEGLYQQITSLQENLETMKTEKTELEEQITDLTSQLTGMESDVNQAKYDKTTATQKLEAIQGEIDSLNESVTDLTTQLEESKAAQAELQEENDTLTSQKAAYEAEIGFYDSYVVFVMLDSGIKYYHKYDCGDFTKKNFLAYSTKLAEANGYLPCPKCIGG